MKVREFIDRLDTPIEDYFNFEYLIREIMGDDFYGLDLNREGFTARAIETWLCTDTQVGEFAIFLHDEFVCISSQSGRKMGVEFRWESLEAYQKVESKIMSLIQGTKPSIMLLDMDEEITNFQYTLNFSGEVMREYHSKAKYNGEDVTIVKTFPGYNEKTWKKVEILLPNGKTKRVNLKEVFFEIPIRSK